MKAFISTLILAVFFICSSAQSVYNTDWTKYYGGNDIEFLYGKFETNDGGNILYGSSTSDDGDLTVNYGEEDGWIIKVDVNGILTWQLSLGSTGSDGFNNICATPDGGYIIAGYSDSTLYMQLNNQKSENLINRNDRHYGALWIVKIDGEGNFEWQSFYGTYEAIDVEVTDDGYMVLSQNDDKIQLVKFDLNGNYLWNQVYGSYAAACSLTKSPDGNILVAGWLAVYTMDLVTMKVSPSGNLIWQKISENPGNLWPDYLVCDEVGNIYYSGRSVIHDYWLLKADPSGEMLWTNSYGSDDQYEFLTCMKESNGRFILSGTNLSGVWIVETDDSGNVIDQFNLGMYGGDIFSSPGPGDTYYTASSQSDFILMKSCKANELTVTLSDSTYCPPALVWGNEGFENYRWTKGSDTDTVFYGDTRVIEVSEGGQYNLTAWNGFGCPSYASINVPDPLFTPQRKDLCFVTVDETAGKNKLVFSEINPQSVVDSIYVYRTNENNEHVIIGRMSIDANEFTDITSNPSQQSYIYSVSNLDTCGLVVGGVQHTTLLLQSSLGANNEVNLSWNQYAGIDYDYVEIYRSINNGAVWEDYVKIAQLPVAILSYTDVNPPSGNKKYQLRINSPEGCAGSMQLISNTEFTNLCGTLSLTVTWTPSHCGLDDGSAMAIASGGTEPYNYTWQGYLQGPVLENLSEGTYHLKVTDNEGCISETLVTVEQAQPTAWAEALPDIVNTTVCEGKIAIHVQDAYPPFTCYLNGSQVPIANDTIYNVCSGTYALTIHSAECVMEVNTEVPNGLTDGVAFGYYRLYPVPAKDKIYLELSEDEAIGAVASVLSLQGTELSRTILTNKKTGIDTAGLHAGLYLLKVCIEGNCFVNRFMKMD